VEAKDRAVCGVLAFGRCAHVCVLINSVRPVPAKLKPDSRVCFPCKACDSPLIPLPQPLAPLFLALLLLFTFFSLAKTWMRTLLVVCSEGHVSKQCEHERSACRKRAPKKRSQRKRDQSF
jgi:hypothetical protein